MNTILSKPDSKGYWWAYDIGGKGWGKGWKIVELFENIDEDAEDRFLMCQMGCERTGHIPKYLTKWIKIETPSIP